MNGINCEWMVVVLVAKYMTEQCHFEYFAIPREDDLKNAPYEESTILWTTSPFNCMDFHDARTQWLDFGGQGVGDFLGVSMARELPTGELSSRSAGATGSVGGFLAIGHMFLSLLLHLSFSVSSVTGLGLSAVLYCKDFAHVGT